MNRTITPIIIKTIGIEAIINIDTRRNDKKLKKSSGLVKYQIKCTKLIKNKSIITMFAIKPLFMEN